MSVQRPSGRDFGELFVELTGQTTLTELQDAVASVVTELRTEDIEMMEDIASTVLETGMEDALESPEVD
ncbi:hypothetical protein GJR96_02990 [Haloferax sp. MBLA0076]|uniref:Uncharacterized protein n=1 Tax=Haloferax litoreum TaxID=2666140 RepID=A0A6A8GCE2_9EURY|nr:MULTISPECIES: hypothetical protein [Haloferax]KAB1192457.1 hypothetical protein Hfx1148_02985 [Haloferax sp. CBA1148]MRX20924.1 hypothetical protein [Haloferax litoreum]